MIIKSKNIRLRFKLRLRMGVKPTPFLSVRGKFSDLTMLDLKSCFIIFCFILAGLFLFTSMVHAQTPISCGQTLADSISAVGQKNNYTFTAGAGDKVTIRVLVTSGGMNPYLELYDSSMTKIAYNYSYSGNYTSIDKALTTGGTYTVVVYDNGNDETGNYNLTWQKLSNPCNATAITCGQAISGSLSAAGQQNFYTFTATAGDKVTIRLVKTSGAFQPQLELYDATGAEIGSGYNYSGNDVVIDKSLSTGGAYTLVVSDYGNDAIGNYNLTWQKLSNPCNATAITCGQAISGSLSAAGQQNFYTFTATAGDKVTIRLIKTLGALQPQLELYDGTGAKIGSGYSYSGNDVVIDKSLSAAGAYTLVVSDYGNDATGNYNLTWQRLNNPCNATNICGQTAVSGSINVTGKQDYYTFIAGTGDNIVLTLTRTSGDFTPCLELYDSSGTRVAYQYTFGTSVTINNTLSVGGTFIVIVSDYGNSKTGNYTLNTQAGGVAVITPNGGEILEPGSSTTVTWKSIGVLCITSQEIRLSKDGGVTFPTVIASGLAGNLRSFVWNIPTDAITTKGRIRVTVISSTGISVSDTSDADFLILQSVPKISRTYVYDKLNRLTQIIYEDGTTINYTYDSVGNRISLSAITQVFIDVPSTYWAYNYIIAIYNAGITKGCVQDDPNTPENERKYCPEDNVTRGQMAAFIIRAKYGENFSYTSTPYFSDVPSTHVFFKYVQKLKDDNITVVSGIYGVDNEVTRGQMAAFIIRAKYGENFSYTSTPYFSDVPSNHTFFKYVQKLKDDKITVVSGTYGVDNIMTRAQMAACIARAFLGMQ